jgi:hypothetical protein
MRKEMENRESDAVPCHQADRTRTSTDTSVMRGKYELVNRRARTGTEREMVVHRSKECQISG